MKPWSPVDPLPQARSSRLTASPVAWIASYEATLVLEIIKVGSFYSFGDFIFSNLIGSERRMKIVNVEKIQPQGGGLL